MASWKFLFLLVVVFLSLSILFLIPSERTGFATQVKPASRTIIGFIFAVIAITFLVFSRTKKRTLEQLLYTESPDALATGILERLKLDPYKEASSADIYTIVDAVGERFGIRKKTLDKMEDYLAEERNRRYLKKEKPLTTKDVAMLCLYYKLHQTLRYEERKRMEKGKRRQIS